MSKPTWEPCCRCKNFTLCPDYQKDYFRQYPNDDEAYFEEYYEEQPNERT